jgi:hypothetical protein
MERCYHCGAAMDFDESVCPHCGAQDGVDPGWGSPHVEFPRSTNPSYDSRRDAVAFLALVDGSPVRFLVTLAALRRRFGVGGRDQAELEAACAARKMDIEAMARKLIRRAGVNGKSEWVITLQDGP